MAQKFLTEITLQALNNATTDTDKFLVSDGGTIKFRTGAEVLSDIGAQPSGSYVPTSRTLTINGVTYDLSANRSWTVSVTETDTLQTVTTRGATTNLAITAQNYIFSGASTGAIGLVTSTSAFGTRSTDGTTYGYGVSTNISGGLDIMANQSGQPIRFWCGTTNVTPIQRMIISNGDVTASDSLRAPIFYDSNNTGYYVDPNSTSNLNIVRAANSLTGAWIGVENVSITSGNGISLYNGAAAGMPTYGLMFAGTATYGTYGSVTSDWATYFTMSDTTTRGWIFKRGSTNIASISGTGILTVGGDVRAPIFYDSNDTVYYLDPNSTTTAANLAGKVVINVGSSSGTPILQATGTYGTMSLNTYYGVFHTSGDFYIGNPAGGAANLTGAQANFNIFSDRNNSAYFADPTSTSNFVGLTVANTISGSITGNSGTVSSITNITGLMVNSLAAPALIDSLTTANFRSILFNTTSNGYQISTARWNTTPSVLSGLSPYSTMIAWSGSDTQGFLAMDYSSAAARVGGGNGNNINWTRRVLLEDAWTNSKYFSSGGEIYAPVFYDANDSSFYFDGSNYGDSIRVGGDIVAYYSDERLKDKKGNIENALEKVLSLNGFYYEPNEIAQAFGYKKKLEVGVSAQEVEAVLPEVVKDAAIGRGYKTLDYGKLTPLLIEAVKEQQKQIEELKELVNKLINK